MRTKYNRIALFGSLFGVKQLLPILPLDNLCVIVAPETRSHEIEEHQKIASGIGVQMLMHPKINSKIYSEFIYNFKGLAPDLIISNQYSMILREDLLKSVSDAINIHWSLLPRNRGPNPIQWSIIKGEKKTGVTIHFIDSGVDTGDIIEQQAVDIGPDDTWLRLNEKLTQVSSDLLRRKLPVFLEKGASGRTQDESKANVNPRLNPDSPKIDFNRQSDLEIYNLVRAQVYPLKGAFIEQTSGQRIYFPGLLAFEDIRRLRGKYASGRC